LQELNAMLEKVPAALGRALRPARAGIEKIAFLGTQFAHVPETIRVWSPAFQDGGLLPMHCTADGKGLSPPLQWWSVPRGAQSVVILVEDADSPTSQPLVHAIASGLPGTDGELAQGAMNQDGADEHLTLGRNSVLYTGWLPPDPPPGHGAHHYAFQVYALNQTLQLSARPGRGELLVAMHGYVMARGCLVGIYQRD
jgi:Raf kinase inhibitor-like YbhB/YbcL family protein